MSGARPATASASADFPTAVVPTNATCRDGRGARGAVPGAIADGRYPAVHGLALFGGVTMVERASMRIDVSISEDTDPCEAIARVRMRDRAFAGWGRARRNPADP